MLPGGSSKLVTRWMVVTIAASLIAAVDGGWLAHWASLSPSRVLHGEVWRLATWPLVHTAPLSLLFTCAAIYKFGGELAPRWGDKRLLRFMLQIVIVASATTCVVAAITGGVYMRRLGGWAATDVLVIAWARQFPERSLVLYGLVTLRGQELVRVTLATAIVFAVFLGPVVMAPELAACVATAWYPRGWLRK